MAEVLHRLGRFCAGRPWLVITAWAVIACLAAMAYVVGHGTLSSAVSIPGTETARVAAQLRERLPEASGGMGTAVFAGDDGTALAAGQRQQISALLAEVQAVDGVRAVVDPFDTAATVAANQATLESGSQRLEAARSRLENGRARLTAAQAQVHAARAMAEQSGGDLEVLAQLDAAQAQIDAQRKVLNAGFRTVIEQEQTLGFATDLMELAGPIRTVAEDQSAALATVVFDADQLEVPPETKATVNRLLTETDIPGVRVFPSNDLTSGLPRVIGPGEVVGVLVAGLALQIMLGTVLAAGLPIGSALVGVAVSSLFALAASGRVEMLSVTPVLGVMLGLAVGIDYALFILNRHRHQLRQGMDVDDSIGLATGTAGNAVVFAGSTVLVALLALNITGIGFLGLMGSVAALSVATAVVVAITLTPALLRLLGHRVLPRRLRDRPEPVDLADRPMRTRTAVLRVVGAAALLMLIALPALSMRLGLPDGSAESTDSAAYQAYRLTAEKFGEGANGPLLVVAELPDPVGEDDLMAMQARVAMRIAATPDISAVAPIGVSRDRTLLAFQVIPTDGPNSESTARVVSTLRERSPLDGGVTLGVAGAASGAIDVSTTLANALPRYLALVVGISLLIMLAVFRSVLVPLIAAAGFVMSLLAAFGGIVAIFQWGWLSSLFGVHDPGPVLSFLPTFLVGVLFGLAMDYQLFLVTGMREAFVHGVEARIAVRRGFDSGKVVVAVAALIMISVFAGFISSEMVVIRSIGFGLALGVALDAYVVRLGLVPALMHLAGKRAWWLPRWLDRILPDVDVEGAALERRHPHPTHQDGRDDERSHAETVPAATASRTGSLRN